MLVHTRSHNEKIEELGLDEYEAWVNAAPADNAANEDLLDSLAYHFGVPVTNIRIKSGLKSRHKLIEIL